MSRALAVILVLLLPAAVPAAEMEDLFPPNGGLPPLAAAGPVETFGPDTLWEKINGEAELYRRFHVRRAGYRLYQLPDDPDATLEAAVYHLGSPLDAFGIYALSRPSSGITLPYGNAATAEGYQAFMRHGAYFITVTAFVEEPLRADLFEKTLRIIAERLGPSPAEIPIVEAVRRTLAADEIGYSPDHLLGRKAFPPGLTFSAGGEIFFVATAPAGEKTLEDIAALLDSSRTNRSEETLFLSGEGSSLGKITVALRGERLAGARTLLETDEARGALLDLMGMELP